MRRRSRHHPPAWSRGNHHRPTGGFFRGRPRTKEERMTSLGIAVAAASLLLTSTLALAANETGGFPDVRGQWKTSVDHVVTGSGPHYRKDANPGQARNEKADVTLTIDRQEGRKFWGNFSAN